MILLQDGPMAGEYPWQHPGTQEPTHIRAVQDPQGRKFILDQTGERPEHNETLLVYQRNGQPFTAITCGRSNQQGQSAVRIAEYHLIPGLDPQPLRDPTAWQEWLQAQPAPEYHRLPPAPRPTG